MNRLLTMLCLTIFAYGCGDDNPTNAGRPIVNETFTVSAGTFRPFSFSIDVDTQRNAYLRGSVTVESGTMSFAVMNEINYQAWQAGQSFNVLYGTNASASIGKLDITETGTYYLVFNNVQASAPATIRAEFSLVTIAETEG